MTSTFETDGYRDGFAGVKPSPPNVPIYAAEYSRGYAAGREQDEREMRQASHRANNFGYW
jgi:hypothetical protein